MVSHPRLASAPKAEQAVLASSITLTGNIMNRDRELCKSCGKPSGLDDLVQNALQHQIHSPQFIIDVLENGPKRASPEHNLQCSKCGETFAEPFGWALIDWKPDV